MIFDPLYLLFMVPAFILSLVAQGLVKSSFSKYSKVGNRRGITGAEAARRILDSSGLSDVRIEPAQGRGLSDHYDPRTKVLRLSPDVYGKASLASVGVAAHEAGHALQDSRGYTPLKLRSALVPAAQLGSNLAWPLLFLGMILGVMGMVKLGVIFFSGAVLFQVVTLPVEFNASARAMRALEGVGILSGDELSGARKVLSAAALTYVAAAVTAVLQLLYFLLRSGLLGGDD
jgi:Zn-dependent membrane protease YugP